MSSTSGEACQGSSPKIEPNASPAGRSFSHSSGGEKTAQPSSVLSDSEYGSEQEDDSQSAAGSAPSSSIYSQDSSGSSPASSISLSSTPSLNKLPLIPKSNPPTSTLDVDLKTPDAHVPRDPRLIRLTGVHPFNVEAPLSELFDSGFLTPAELFYVRNHGAVPEVLDSQAMDWTLSVEGLVAKPYKITLREILSDFDNVTCPATLVCAGNRRKEQNIVKKTKGFSWGAAGVSTALFSGVMMRDIVERARPHRSARYVCMEGADKLPNGYYGTSVKLNWVMDPNRGIMVAHGMNAEPLRPDHGKPLRVVIPGQIGGRSVKWLTKLIVTAAPSDNWYHIYDNRVLPTELSPEQAAEMPDTWKDERYAIYDLSCNSAIAFPAHDERISLEDASLEQKYSVRGYAYSGGGRRVTRVEISLDQGRKWRLAQIEYPEDLYREANEDTIIGGGRLDMSWRESCFCWCFWRLDLGFAELGKSKDILVRCMDESMTIQPRDMYWSVLGMMNNPWFRVAIHHEDNELRFEHPTQPALMPGGWMERVKKAGGNLMNGAWGEMLGSEQRSGDGDENTAQDAEVKITNDAVNTEITLDELRSHSSEKEPWFVLQGQVYDGTKFLEEHPGGAQSIISAAGTDATDEFMAIHSSTAKAMMPAYHIGKLDDDARSAIADGDLAKEDASVEPRQFFLQSRAWTTATLHERKELSWDTRVLTYKLEHEDQLLGLPTGQHLMIRHKDPSSGENLIRSYTPVSQQGRKGFVDVLVKIYFDTEQRKGGKMSQAMNNMPIGGTLEFKGPIGKFEYVGRGRCRIHGKERNVQRFIMICGGSGITPIYQVLRAVMQDEHDKTHCTVLNSNRLLEDILCKEDLDSYAAANELKCKLLYTLTQAPDDWKGLKGRIAGPLLKEHAPCSNEGKTLALICGPEPLETSVRDSLKGLGWKDEDMLFF